MVSTKKIRLLDEGSSLTSSNELYCVLKGRREGEEDLVSLARRANHEGSWIYDGRGIWHNLSVGTFSVDSPIDRRGLGVLSYSGLSFVRGARFATHYHTHLRVGWENTLEYSVNKGKDILIDSLGIEDFRLREDEIMQRLQEGFEKLCYLRGSIPSTEDLEGYASYESERGELSMDYRIAFDGGIIKVDLIDPRVVEDYRSLVSTKNVFNLIEGTSDRREALVKGVERINNLMEGGIKIGLSWRD